MTYAVLSFIDSSNEQATMSFPVDDILGDGTNYPALLTAIQAVQDAVDDVTLGNIREKAVIAARTRLNNIIPNDGAERESKWLVRYQDDVTFKVHTMEIPCADRTALPMQTASDFVDLNATGVDPAVTNKDALLTALNTHMKSSLGNDTTVISIEKVGRNL